MVAVLLILPMLSVAPVQRSYATDVGAVTKLYVWAFATPSGGSRDPIFVRDPISFGSLLETVSEGGLEVLFEDDSVIQMGPDTELLIDEFVYDPTGGSESAVFNLSLGVLRYVSGSMREEGITIRTPAAGIGLRGTVVFIFVAPDGTTYVAVDDGSVLVTASVSGDTATVERGKAVIVSADGRTIRTSGPRLRPPFMRRMRGGQFPLGSETGGDSGAGSDPGEADSSGSSGGGNDSPGNSPGNSPGSGGNSGGTGDSL